MALTPRAAFARTIARWEGLYQADPNDLGNVIHRPGGALYDGPAAQRSLAAAQPGAWVVGTMRGVTPAAWAAHKGLDLARLTPAAMLAITLDDAAGLGEAAYYRAPGFARLPWGPAIEVAADIGWGSGPQRGIKALQACCGTAADGAIGAQTAAAYRAWLLALGHDRCVEALRRWRRAWYEQCARAVPGNQRFLKGWLARADWQSVYSPPWWLEWQPLPPLNAADLVPAEPPPPAPAPAAEDGLARDWYRALLGEIGPELADSFAAVAAQSLVASVPGFGAAVAAGRKAVDLLLAGKA